MKNYLSMMVLMISLTSVNAQESSGVSSITLGVSPYGYARSYLSGGKDIDLDCDYFYKKVMAANVCYEIQGGGVSLLAELSYARGDFDHYDVKGAYQAMSYNVYQTESLQDFGLTLYCGGTLIGKNKRVQLPIYIGAGGEYVKGGALKNACLDLAAKLRLKFYISNHFGVYVGGTARWGLIGWITDKHPDSSEKDVQLYPSHLLCMPDAGIVISF